MATLYISMTSGSRGPELELTDEQANHISELISELSVFWAESKFFGMGLGPTNYIVSWGDKYAFRVIPEGLVSIWSDGAKDWQYFKDTVGIWKYLEPIGTIALQEWKNDMQKQMDEFNEEMFGTSE